MPDPARRLNYEGFDLRLENGFGEDEARAVLDRVLAEPGDRIQLVVPLPVGGKPVPAEQHDTLYVKAKFRRRHEPLGKRGND